MRTQPCPGRYPTYSQALPRAGVNTQPSQSRECLVREDANIGPMNSERVLSWDTLAPAAQLQLLGNSFMRVRDGCTVMPLLGLPGLAWLYSLGLWPPGITLWWGASLLLVGAVWGVWGLWQRALKQRDSHDAATLLAVWLPRVQALAALYGALVMSSAASLTLRG